MTDVIDTQNTGAQSAGSEQKPYYDGWNLSNESVGFLQSLNYKDANALVEGLKQTRSYVGVDKNDLIRIPKPDKDGNIDLSEVYKQLGRPETPKEYGLEDSEFGNAIAQKLYDVGLSKKQATALMEFMVEQDNSNKKKADEEWDAAVTKGTEALKKEWGSEYETNVAVAQQAVRDIAAKTGFTEDELNKIEQTLGTDKATKLFYSIGAAGGGVKSLQNYNAGQETPEIAAYKLKELQKDKEFVALLAKNDHKAVKEMNRLTALAMGGK